MALNTVKETLKDKAKDNTLTGMFGPGMFGLGDIFREFGKLLTALKSLLSGDFTGFMKFFDDDAPADTPRRDPRQSSAPQADKNRLAGPSAAPAQTADTAPATAIRLAPPTAETMERQTKVMTVLADAARTANVSPELMVGVWGRESTFGQNLKSPTGCLGDWQFSRVAMTERIGDRGHVIAARLRAFGLDDEAKAVETIHAQTKDLTPAQITAYAKDRANFANIDALRNNEYISTYAASFHLRVRASELGLNPHQKENFGLIYAGYNIGTKHAAEILAGGRASGWEVDANKGIAGAANQRLAYDRAVSRFLNTPTGQIFSDHAKREIDLAQNDQVSPRESAIRVVSAARTGQTLETTPSLRQSAATAIAGAPGAQPVIVSTNTVLNAQNDPAYTNKVPILVPSYA